MTLKTSVLTAWLLIQTHGEIVRLGTDAPPSEVAGIALEPFPVDTRDLSYVSTVATGFGNDITFTEPLEHRRVPDSWNTWSHDFEGDIYFYSMGGDVTIILPPLCAFVFYVEPNSGTESFELVLSNGDSVTEDIEGSYGAKGFAVYASDGGAPITSVEITNLVGDDFAVGEFYAAPADVCAIEMCEDVYDYIGDNSAVSVALDASQFPADASGLYVYVDLEHTFLGDLSIRVQHSNATKMLLHSEYDDCGSEDDLRAYFSDYGSDELCSSDHSYDEVYDLESYESLAHFNSLPKNGIWNVTVMDNANGDEGTLKKVCVGWGERPDRDGDDDDSSNNGSGLSGAAIGGIVAAVIVCICLLFCYLRYRLIASKSPATVAPYTPAVASSAVQNPAAAVSMAPRAAAPMRGIGGFPSAQSEGMADTRWAAPVAAIGAQPISGPIYPPISAPPVYAKVPEWALPAVDPSTFGGFPRQHSESLSAYVTPSNDPIFQATAAGTEMMPPTYDCIGEAPIKPQPAFGGHYGGGPVGVSAHLDAAPSAPPAYSA